MRYQPVQTGNGALARYGELFAACFPDAARFTPAYLAWLYAANPDGAAAGFDAWDGERLAAHYACIPARAWVNGAPSRVLLSLNTATHPAWQGQGLFTRLAAMTYEAAAGAGVDGVYGVANANSTPGFVRKLGFQLVRPLEARVGIGPLHHDLGPHPANLSFARDWSADALAWRCANPNNPVWQRAHNGRAQFYAAAFGPGLPAYAELEDAPAVSGAAPALSPLRLFIGLAPDAGSRYWNYASIPKRLRPSPLNLIYRPLASGAAALDPARIAFSFLDFDAY